MRKLGVLLLLSCCFLLYNSFAGDDNKPVSIPYIAQTPGDAATGYKYLTTGDYLKSGIPYKLFKMASGKRKENYLNRTGQNKTINYDFTAVNAPNGRLVVAPNCLQCHAQIFDGQLYIGLGNSTIDFSIGATAPKMASFFLKRLIALNKKDREAATNFLQGTGALAGKLTTLVRGVNAADHLAGILAAHRQPETLKWSNTPMMDIPSEVIPTDVPAWWLLKKKNAMFYNGFGRGNFARFLMASNLLTVSDTTEAREVYSHFDDVLAYLYTLEPPKYPKAINLKLAAAGQALFGKNCTKCHGEYGAEEKYPNLLIPAQIIKTDSALYTANYSSPEVIKWFNKSWFAMGENPAQLVPYKGYIAPPLDGVWITAPYLHNGSVPTLEGVLNSKARPAYWSRNFNQPEYDYAAVGWKHQVHDAPKRKVYNTTVNGYGNMGHYFGDKLSDHERKAVIEYLKTL